MLAQRVTLIVASSRKERDTNIKLATLLVPDHTRAFHPYRIISNDLRKRCVNSSPLNLPQQTGYISRSIFASAKYPLSSCPDAYTKDGYTQLPRYPLSTCYNHRFFHSSSSLRYAEKPSSKVEESVHALKEKAKEAQEAATDASKPKDVVVKKSIKQKVIDELVHYYHGFRLLFIDISVSAKLVTRILSGQQLSRRERNLVSYARTCSLFGSLYWNEEKRGICGLFANLSRGSLLNLVRKCSSAEGCVDLSTELIEYLFYFLF